MKEFFISAKGLPFGWEKEFSEFSFRVFNCLYEDGYLIPQLALPQFLKKINRSVLRQEYISPIMNKAHLTKAGPTPFVTLGGWNGKRPEEFIKLTEKHLLPILQQNITIYVTHGKYSQIMDDGNFHVHIWASAINEFASKPPLFINGILVPCRDFSMKSSTFGNKIIANDSNYSLGEVIANDLFIHHDICHTGDQCELVLYELIMKKTKLILRNKNRSCHP